MRFLAIDRSSFVYLLISTIELFKADETGESTETERLWPRGSMSGIDAALCLLAIY